MVAVHFDGKNLLRSADRTAATAGAVATLFSSPRTAKQRFSS
jgi:hypothetical protein